MCCVSADVVAEGTVGALLGATPVAVFALDAEHIGVRDCSTTQHTTCLIEHLCVPCVPLGAVPRFRSCRCG